jgi:hypothetical protein
MTDDIKYPHVEEVRSLIATLLSEINDVGPWGDGYWCALDELSHQLDLRFGKSQYV